MQVRHDARIVTTDHQPIGKVDRVVIDPRTRLPSHVVVCRGGLFAADRVLPMDWVSEAQESELILRVDPQELDALPLYEEANYISGDQPEGVRSRDRASYAAPCYFYPPITEAQSMAEYLYPDAYGVATGPAVVGYGGLDAPTSRPGARALSSDGHYIGEVAGIVTSPGTERVTHFVITRGLLVKEHKVIPRHWISQMGDGELWIAVSDRMIGRLPDVEPGQLS